MQINNICVVVFICGKIQTSYAHGMSATGPCYCLKALVRPQKFSPNETSLESGPYKVALIKQTACIAILAPCPGFGLYQNSRNSGLSVSKKHST